MTDLEPVPVSTLDTHDSLLSGWRVFTLTDGGLVPPFLSTYWPERIVPGDLWQPGLNVARCIASDHRAPAVDCTCGLRAVLDFDTFAEVVTTRHFAGSERSMLEDCPVVARVRLVGLTLPGSAMPRDDPLGTVRAAAASLLEIHLPKAVKAKAADALAERYGVDVWRHSARDWPGGIDPAIDLLADVHAVGFGGLDLGHETTPDVLLTLADHILTGLRAGCGRLDAASALFDSPARPTVVQAKALVEAVVRNLGPELADDPDELYVGREVSPQEAHRRMFGLPTS